MKTTTYDANVETAYGTKLPEKVPFKYDAKEFVSVEECKNAGEWLKDSEILDTINASRRNTARQAQQVEVLAGMGYKKPTLKTSDLLKLQTLYKVFISVEGTTHEQAREKASENLGGMQWPD